MALIQQIALLSLGLKILSVSAQTLNSSCIPSQVLNIAPACAISCIQAFITSEYASLSCKETSQLDNLCVTTTPSGFTIGEAAYQCVISDCAAEQTGSVLSSTYNICAGVPGAVAETQLTTTSTPVYVYANSSVPTSTGPKLSNIASATKMAVSSSMKQINTSKQSTHALQTQTALSATATLSPGTSVLSPRAKAYLGVGVGVGSSVHHRCIRCIRSTAAAAAEDTVSHIENRKRRDSTRQRGIAEDTISGGEIRESRSPRET